MKKVLFINGICIGIYTVVRIITSFLFTRAFLVAFGSELNGFYNSVLSLMNYLNIAEGGVGAATTYALYKPIAEKDYHSMNRILSFTHKYFRRLGIILSGCIMVISIFYPHMVKGFNEGLRGTLVVLALGSITVTEYLFDGKYKCLLNAQQKLNLRNIAQAVFTLITKGVAIFLCYNGYPFWTVLLSICIEVPLRVVFYSVIIRNKNEWIDYSVEPDDSIRSFSRDLFIQKISSLLFSTTDVMLISVFVGAAETSVYSVYNMVISGMTNLILIVCDSPSNLLGKYYVEDKQKFEKLYHSYEMLAVMLTTMMVIVYLFLIHPFISLYTDGVNDIDYYDNYMARLMGLNFVLCYYRSLAASSLNAAGFFKAGKIIFSVEAIINLICSIIFLKIMGCSGVVMGSVIARAVSICAVVKVAYCDILKQRISQYFRKVIPNVVMFTAAMFCFKRIDLQINRWDQFICFAMAIGGGCSLIVLFINIILNRNWMPKLKKGII